MALVFADTGYWIALWNPRDALHQGAMTLADSLGDDETRTTLETEEDPKVRVEIASASPIQRIGVHALSEIHTQY